MSTPPKPLTILQAHGLALALQKATGEIPAVVYYTDGHAELTYTPDQVKKLRVWLQERLSKKGGPDQVKLNFEPVIWPLVLKAAIPYIIMLLAAGYITGYLTRR